MFDAHDSEQYGTSFGRENGTVILNAMTVAVINENCCYRDPLSVFRISASCLGNLFLMVRYDGHVKSVCLLSTIIMDDERLIGEVQRHKCLAI